MNEDDDVANQAHYAKQAIQPIEYMRACMTPEQFEGYLRGNVLKYISRYPMKDGVKDLRKAATYLRWLTGHLESRAPPEEKVNR